MTVNVKDIGWSHYHSNEGPFFGGLIRVPEALRSAPFAERVLSLTSAAEGNFDAVNMYDTGLVSVGAIQFIDAGSFQVTDMLGAVADELGVDYINAALKPALDLTNTSFIKVGNAWRFSFNNTSTVVNTKDTQKQLYFGDTNGNTLGSYDDTKRLRAKTWAACLANVWADPHAVAIQSHFTLPRLISGFVWNELKQDLFTGDQPEDGWIGAVRAMLLSFAVNAPAIVVKRYAACRSNGLPFGSPEWCLAVLHGVVVGAGIDVWPARWVAERALVKRMFGVTLPTYVQLTSGVWDPPLPAEDPTPAPPQPAPDPTPKPDPHPTPPEPTPIPPTPDPPPLPPNPGPLPAPIVAPASGAFAILVQLVKMMMEVIARVLGKTAP